MRFLLRFWIVLLFTVAPACFGQPDSGPIVVIPLKTQVSQAQFFFLRRALKDAENRKASAIVIDMETYGGEVKAAIDSMDALMKTTVPTLTYIDNKAISAGALITVATQKIYMAPTGVIGAAAPVLAGGEDMSKTMSEKTISALSAMARAAAQKNGHDPEVATAFIDKEKEVKRGDVIVSAKGSLLTLSAEEAAKVYDGKPLLAAGIAKSLEEVISKAGLTGNVEKLEPTGFEVLAFWITTFAPLFLLGGMIGGYIEFKTPGFGLPGLISIVCFALFFTGHYIAGLAGREVMVCFAVGVALVAFELIVMPGTILPGLIGGMMIVASLVWAMIDRYPNQPFWPSDEMLVRPLINMVVAFVAAGIAIAFLAKLLPKSPFYRRIALGASVAGGPGVSIPAESLRVHEGMTGSAKTALRPSGKGEFNELVVDVVSQGDFIDPGGAIRVVQVEGARVVVERA